jgi:hypothetical protein
MRRFVISSHVTRLQNEIDMAGSTDGLNGCTQRLAVELSEQRVGRSVRA